MKLKSLKLLAFVLTLLFFSFELLGCQAGSQTAPWGECSMTYGLNAEAVPLTQAKQDELYSQLTDWSLQKVSKEAINNQEKLYGGVFYCVEFSTGNEIERWHFSGNAISKTKIINDEATEVTYYAPDTMLLNYLGSLKK